MFKKLFSILSLVGFVCVLWFSFRYRVIEYRGLFNLPSLLLVVVGHLLIVFYSYTPAEIYRIWKKTLHVFFNKETLSSHELTHRLVGCSVEFQTKGKILPRPNENNAFLSEAIQLFNNNYPEAELKKILKNRWQAERLKGLGYISYFEFSAKIAPALGMMGTILGLINLLQNMEDFNMIGSGMALALLTTFYGLIVSFGFYHPIARRLYTVAVEGESYQNAMIVDAMELIKKGLYGPILKEHLLSYKINDEKVTTKKEKSGKKLEPIEVEV